MTDGRLTVDGERAVLTFERHLPFPIEAVWSAITDPGERQAWFGETTLDARAGVVPSRWCPMALPCHRTASG